MNFKKFKELATDWASIKCEIDDTEIKWKITVEDWIIFICQNKIEYI